MPVTRRTKSAAKKKTASPKKRTSTKRRSTSGKVYIPAYKAVILCLVVIVICLVLLLISTVSKNSRQVEDEIPSSIAERFEPAVPETQKKPEPVRATETVTKKDTTDKKEETAPKKPAEKTSEKQTPKKEPEKKKAASFGFEKARNQAQLCFVFDDGGQNLEHLKTFLDLPFPITVAVLPQITHSKDAADLVRKSGNELILHQPMQSVNEKINPGPGAITPDMSDEQICAQLFVNLTQIGPVAGINNHEGSGITADAQKMEVILKLASDEGIYFLDSRTNVETQVPYVAGELGYSWYERNIFLDNQKTRENALAELKKGLTIANKNGSVIMIGHIWSADFLPQLLKEAYPELKEKGYTFSIVSKSKALKK